MKPSDFHKPEKHPWGMLDSFDIRNKYETEFFLCWMLIQSQEQESWEPIKTQQLHCRLVNIGLLKEVQPFLYQLTPKALGLLYTKFGKEV